jgi:EAL domain-containing protein (putative c-di-GMP-specific phosphodiesterase class I)
MGLPQCESAALLLQAFGKLLTQLGKTALVEGVETSEQESMVRSYGYNIAQGFYYSRPIRRQIAIERFFDDKNRSDSRAA